MKAKNVTDSQMKQAMDLTNRQYGNNVSFERFDAIKNGFNFTLRTLSSRGPGHRLSFTGRRMPKACWHVHRDFMRHLFKLQPTAKIVSCRATYDGVADFEAKFQATGYANIGSMMSPMSFQDACEC